MECSHRTNVANRMKAAVCVFTYKEDSAALLRAVEFVHHNLPGVPIYVFDDARAPLQVDDQALHRVDGYDRTTFDRRGNLNGRECVMGELSCFLHVARETGAERILKLDADTAILSQQILEFPGDLVGVQWAHRFVAGSVYLLNSSLLERMIYEVTRLGGLPPEEDAAMSKLVKAAGGRINFADEQFATAFKWGDERIPVTHYLRSKAVTFGRREWIDAADSVKRLVVGAGMSAFFHAAYNRGAVHPCQAQDMELLPRFLERPPGVAIPGFSG